MYRCADVDRAPFHKGGLIALKSLGEEGECVAVFRPRLLTNRRQERHLCYVWDGKGISKIYEQSEFA